MVDSVIRVAVVGPESSGKSTLAAALAERIAGACLVTEYARNFLSTRPKYSYGDLVKIAKGQLELEKKAGTGYGVRILDTDMLTIFIWSRFVFGRVDAEINRMFLNTLPDLYLLCRPDIPWEYDPLREHPHQRDEIFDLNLQLIKRTGVQYVILEGDFDSRLNKALASFI
ncbi:MAG: hypothetical protein EA358_01915 [Flavobacteriales bacterium]|nr:MAG: hypothetical protein EA358_01915 [Flavobacteriales bacterium]